MIIDDLKEIDILILKKMFSLSKDGKRPSPVQGKILMYLYKNKDKDIYQKDLENIIHSSKVSLSEMLNKLENSGDIERISTDDDKRKKKIILTEKSLSKLKSVRKCLLNLENVLLDNFSNEEKETLIKLLGKMKKNLKEDNDDKVI